MKKFLAYIDKSSKELILKEELSNPSYFNDATLQILFVGELLNKHPLKEELFIAESYRTLGINCLKNLEGSFSLVIYDKEKEKFFIVKDKRSISPLYFMNNPQKFICGTHLRDFQTIQGLKLEIDPNVLGSYLQFGFVLQPNSIFKNAHKLQAGEYLCFNLKDRSYNTHNYWKLESCYTEPKTKESEKHILTQAHQLLQESIEQNCFNKNFGVSLSGGYDSATIASICQAQSSQKIDTFTIGFHENKINEAPYAKAVAKHLNTRHHEHYFLAKDALELIPKICKVYDEPFADHASSPTILTAQLLKAQNKTTLIAGDGGDEVFATAEDVERLRLLKNTPLYLKYLLAKPLVLFPFDKMPYLKNYNNLPKKQSKLIQILLAKNIPEIIYHRNTLFLEEELQHNIKGYNQKVKTSFDTINFQGSAEVVDEIIGTYFKTTMIDGELVKSYGAMNYYNISLSTPYLNTKLIDYMSRVPSHIKIKNGTKKYLLKEIAYKYIPKKLIERPKCGFDIPFGQWMKNELKELVYAQVSQARLDKENLFYTSSILNIRDQFYAGNDAYKYKLWRIFIFQLWYENFLKTTPKG